MKAIFTKLERKRKRVSTNVMRKLSAPMGEAKGGDPGFDALTALMDIKEDLLAGTLQPAVAIKKIRAIAAGGNLDAFDKVWIKTATAAAKMIAAWNKIERRRPKGLHLRGKRGQRVFITKSARGDAPSGRPWQLSYGDDVQRRDAPGKQFAMFGHNYQPSIRAAFIDAWENYGPLKVIEIVESLEEAAGWVPLAEAKRFPVRGMTQSGSLASEARILSREEFRELSQMRKDIKSGRRKAEDVLAFIDSKWTPAQIKSDDMLPSMRRFVEGRAVWDRKRLDRVKRGLAVKTAKGDIRYITRSARGDAPAGKPWQLTRGSERGGAFEPHGHENYATIRDAFFDAWDWDGPLKVVNIAEAFEYGMRLRPPAPGAVPKGFTKIGKHPRFRHGTVSYDRKLTSDEVRSYELEPLFGKTVKRSELLAHPRPTSIRELTAFAVKVFRTFPKLKADLLDVVKDAKTAVADGDGEKDAARYAHQAIAWTLEEFDPLTESLDERSFSTGDIPKEFRVVFSVDKHSEENHGTLSSLAKREINGITGISDSAHIEVSFLGIARDAVLLMPGAETVKLNRLTRVMYDNPLYMVSNNAAALRRVFALGARETSSVVENLLGYVVQAIRATGKHRESLRYLDNVHALRQISQSLPGPFKDMKRLVKRLRVALKVAAKKSQGVSEVAHVLSAWSDAEWYKWLKAAIRLVRFDYGHEGEWMLKGDTLKIPRGSKLRLLSVWQPSDPEYQEYARKADADKLPMGYSNWSLEKAYERINLLKKHGLTAKYDIEWIRTKDWKQKQVDAQVKYGHANAAARKAWAASFESVLDEAMPSSARTTFDSAPYSNMRLLDVARLLQGASQQTRPNVSLITKLVDRLVHALEFTIYSIQGRPEGRRIGTMIRKAFNNLTANLPTLAVGERRDALKLTTRLNEAVEVLEFGPVEWCVR